MSNDIPEKMNIILSLATTDTENTCVALRTLLSLFALKE